MVVLVWPWPLPRRRQSPPPWPLLALENESDQSINFGWSVAIHHVWTSTPSSISTSMNPHRTMMTSMMAIASFSDIGVSAATSHCPCTQRWGFHSGCLARASTKMSHIMWYFERINWFWTKTATVEMKWQSTTRLISQKVLRLIFRDVMLRASL